MASKAKLIIKCQIEQPFCILDKIITFFLVKRTSVDVVFLFTNQQSPMYDVITATLTIKKFEQRLK